MLCWNQPWVKFIEFFEDMACVWTVLQGKPKPLFSIEAQEPLNDEKLVLLMATVVLTFQDMILCTSWLTTRIWVLLLRKVVIYDRTFESKLGRPLLPTEAWAKPSSWTVALEFHFVWSCLMLLCFLSFFTAVVVGPFWVPANFNFWQLPLQNGRDRLQARVSGRRTMSQMQNSVRVGIFLLWQCGLRNPSLVPAPTSSMRTSSGLGFCHGWRCCLSHILVWCNTPGIDMAEYNDSWLSNLTWTSEEILQWVHEASPQMPNQIRRAVARFLIQEQTIHHVARMHRDIKSMCQAHGVLFDDPPAMSEQEPIVDFFPCPTCSKVFSTVQELTAHRWKQHGHISEERRFVYNGVCEGCRKCFWTAQRLQQHLRYSKRKPDGCYWWVSQHLDPLPAPERVDMPAIHRGQHRLPCVEAQGPQPQTITTRWSRQHHQNWHLWQTEWRQAGFPEDLSEAICDRVLTDISAATHAWSSEPSSDLTWIWCEIVEEYASDAEQYPHALWAFALWVAHLCMMSSSKLRMSITSFI